MEPQTMNQYPFGNNNTMDEDSTYYSSPPTSNPTIETPKKIQKHSPMLIYMPETTYSVNVRFRIRAHPGSDPQHRLAQIGRCLSGGIELARSTHPTKESVIAEIERAVKAMAVTEPYSNPDSWKFVVAKEVIDRIPKLTQVEVSEEYWPYVPLSVMSNGEYIISLISQHGPPRPEIMREWMNNSGNAYMWEQCFDVYHWFYEEEWRLDMNTKDRFYPLVELNQHSNTQEDSGTEQDMEMDEVEAEVEAEVVAPPAFAECSSVSRKRRFSDVAPPGSEIGLQGMIQNRKKARCHMSSASLSSSGTISFNSIG